jgi:hypothetical protein
MVREPNQSGTEGAALLAPAAGTVNQSFYHDNAGNVIQVDHGGGHFTTYLHLQSRSVDVGDGVTQGQLIGRVGKTGPTSNGHPHLHYEQGFDSNGNGSVTWGFDGAERVAASFGGTTYTGSGRTWRNVTSRNCGGSPSGPALAYDQGDGTMRIYRWQSTGSSFSRTSDYDSGPFHLSNVDDRVATGDVNGDGHDDIVMAYQRSDGTFTFNVFPSGSTSAGTWYTSGPFNLGPVAGRLTVGAW